MRVLLFAILFQSFCFAQNWAYLGEYELADKEKISVYYDSLDIEEINAVAVMGYFLIEYKTVHISKGEIYDQCIIKNIMFPEERIFSTLAISYFLNGEHRQTNYIAENEIKTYNFSQSLFVSDFLILYYKTIVSNSPNEDKP
jgi:hypothetical protein